MKKNKITGLIGTAVLHILLLILLLVIAIRRPQVQEEGGVPVMLGNTELSQGNADPYTLTDIDIMNEPEAPAPDVSEPETVPPVEAKEEIITQTEEETEWAVTEHLTSTDVLWVVAVCRCLSIMCRMRDGW